MAERSYTGACFCGAIEIALTGTPEAMGYCHCQSCRAWSAAPVNAFTLWKPANVSVTLGASELGTFRKTDASHRRFCRRCGGHVMTDHPGFGLVDVYAAVIADFAFEPTLHVHYGETVAPMRDGLPKFDDLPAEMGGSGTMLAE